MPAAQVRRHEHGPRLIEDAAVEVELGGDGSSDDSPAPPRPPASPRILAWVGGVGVLALAALLGWPSGADEPAVQDAADGSVASWPARGSLADSPGDLRGIEVAWRSVSDDSSLAAPGEVVEPLYLGEPDGTRVGLVRSWTQAGSLAVAAAIQDGSGWRLLDAARVDADAPWLVLPGSDPPRVLAAPDVAAAAALLLRRDDGVWTRVAFRGDGVSATLRSLDGPSSILGVVASIGPGRGLAHVATLSPSSVVPLDPPVRAGAPRWGRASALTPAEYDAALYAAPAVLEGAGRLVVLASAKVPGGRAVLAETQSSTDGQYRRVLVVPGDDGSVTLGPTPQVEDGLAAAVAPRGGDRTLVLAASSPSIARVEVVLPDGTSVIDGFGPTAVVLAPPVPDEVTVLGKRTNGSVVASLVLPVDQEVARSPG